MLNSELISELKKKSLHRVKQTNPVLKKLIVTIINRTGSLLFFFRKKVLPENVKKILFVSLYFNGDIIFHSAVFELVRKIYPDAEIHIWTKTRAQMIISGYPYIKKVFVFDDVRTRRYDEEVKLNLNAKFNFFRELKKEQYDLGFDLTGLFWTAFALWYAGVKYSSGINFQGFGFLYNNESEAIYNGHLIDKHLNLILNDPLLSGNMRAFENEERKPRYYISAESVENVERIFESIDLSKKKKIITLHTTAGWEAKTWSVSNFKLLAELLCQHYLIIIIGSGQDIENGRIISEKLSTGIIDLTAKLTISESAEVIRRSDLFIGTDSGPLYLAEAVGTKTLSLFGPTNPRFSAPRGNKHIYIYKELFCSSSEIKQNCKLQAGLNCRTVDCMKLITPEEVFKLVSDIT